MGNRLYTFPHRQHPAYLVHYSRQQENAELGHVLGQRHVARHHRCNALKSTGTQSWGANILLYVLGKFSHAVGDGAQIFLLLAELFPTKYRASCHGISAAIGKFGSLLGLIFLICVTFGQGQTKYTPSSASSTWLSYVFMVCAVPVFLGAVVSWLGILEFQDSSGKSKTLEQLAEGRRSARSDIVADSD